MHKDEVKGAAKETSGKIKDKLGEATGNKKLEAEGEVDQAEGKVQKSFGKAKESVRDALKH